MISPEIFTMKYAAIIEYIQDKEKIASVRPTHREYLRQLITHNQLAICGPFTDDSGALIVYEAGSHDEAESLLQNDPFHKNGIFVKYEIRPWNTVMGNPDLLPGK